MEGWLGKRQWFHDSSDEEENGDDNDDDDNISLASESKPYDPPPRLIFPSRRATFVGHPGIGDELTVTLSS